MTRSDKPPAEIEQPIAAAGTFALQQNLDQADVYLGLIEGAPDSDCLRNLLWAAGMQIPILIVTSATNPAPAWVLAMADYRLFTGPGVCLEVAAQHATRWADRLVQRRPWAAKARRN